MNSPMPLLSESDRRRFLRNVIKKAEDECWPWYKSTNTDGYGQIKIQGVMHRIAYWLKHNVDPGEFLVLHSCDNRRCCNPKHLFLGDDAINNEDMMNKGRYVKGKICKGEEHYMAELTWEIVRKIRFDVALGIKQREVAKKYNTTPANVWLIVHNINWKE